MYSSSARSGYNDYHNSGRNRSNSDATLTNSPEYRHQRAEQGYDLYDHHGYDYHPSSQYAEDQYERHPQESMMYPAAEYYAAQVKRNSRSPVKPAQHLRFDEDDEYDEDYHHSTPSVHPSRYVQRGQAYPSSQYRQQTAAADYEREYETYRDDNDDDDDHHREEYDDRRPVSASYRDHHNDLPRRSQGAQPITVHVAYSPPTKDKKPSISKRIKQSFREISRNPDDELLGCTPGRPTPQHLLDQAAKEKAKKEALEKPRPSVVQNLAKHGAQADDDHAYQSRTREARHGHDYDETRNRPRRSTVSGASPSYAHQYDRQSNRHSLPAVYENYETH